MAASPGLRAVRSSGAPEQLGLLDDSHDCRDGDRGIHIRTSRRARRLTLKVVPPYRLELVVPRGTSGRCVEAFLRQSESWISRTRKELDARYPARLRSLPEKIELAAIDKTWPVDLRIEPDCEAALRIVAERLELAVASQADRHGFELLRHWLLARGREYLKPWLRDIAEELGLRPQRVQIRTQRTRWGSCTGQGGISLNAALLLLSPALVRYLMVHELCHLQHLNHSRRYWRLVARHDPDFEAHDAALADAWTRIPVWALPAYS